MDFTVDFLLNLARLLSDFLALLIGLSVIICLLSVAVGRREGWPVADSLYFGFITALTVGYGDIRPITGMGKILAVVVGLLGLITTGIIVAIAVETASMTYDAQHARAA